MNIALVPWIYLPTIGGIQTNAANLAKGLTKLGHKVIIVTTKYPSNLSPRDIIDGIKVYRLPFISECLPQPNSIVKRASKHILEIALIPLTIVKLWLLVKRNQIQVINVHFTDLNAFYVTLLSHLYKFKFVITLRGYAIQHLPHLGRLRKWIFYRGLKRADYIISVSKSLLEQSLTEYSQFIKKSFVINNAPALSEFEDKERFSYDKPYILFMGRIERVKAFDILLMAFRALLDEGYKLDLIAAGSCILKEDYQKLIRLLGLEKRVILLGEVNRSHIVKLLNGCQFVVLPSRMEPAATVILETMAAGKTIVATAVDGTPEFVIDGENGILVKPNSTDALTAGIKKLLDRPELRESMERRGRLLLKKRFSLDKMVDSYLKVYSY